MAGVEESNIRGLEIDRVVKATANIDYIFKRDVAKGTATTDSIRWYNKTTPNKRGIINANHIIASFKLYLAPGYKNIILISPLILHFY